MTERSFGEVLEDILEAISEIESFTKDVNLPSFQENREKCLAVVKLLEIIGEAVKKIPQSFVHPHRDFARNPVSLHIEIAPNLSSNF